MNNRELKEFFIGFLEDKGYNNHDGKMSKGFVVINFMANGKMIRAADKNPTHSHGHIVSCKTPPTIEDADTWYFLLEIEKKEMGSSAWKVLKKREHNDEKNG